MPIRHSLEEEFVLIDCEGDFDVVDIHACAAEIAKGHSTKARLRLLLQDLGSNFDPDTEELKALVNSTDQRNMLVSAPYKLDGGGDRGSSEASRLFGVRTGRGLASVEDRENAQPDWPRAGLQWDDRAQFAGGDRRDRSAAASPFEPRAVACRA